MPFAVKTALPSSTIKSENSIWVNTDEVVIQGYGDGSSHCHNDGKIKIIDMLKSRFVLPKTLKVIQLRTVNGITTKFPTTDEKKHLPQFNTQNLAQNLEYFSITPNSEEAYVMNMTINKWLKGLTAISPPSPSNVGIRRYNVKKVELLESDQLLLCHRYGFPYAVFYCHQPTATKAFSVHLSAAVESEDGGLEAIAVCHMETSKWSANYIGFKALGVKPGTPICHFLHSRDLLMYVPN
ncbi:BURP domain-containing protein 5-like [Spinacia oleracea]|uniref:BURP domain-containing protein 5-like n=1 Tax=Spinacia oleracea TaxID=3562 RepID=A0ABM3QHY5_SPIOL|nr:BURP domain-containing protein 5-like [Spinacia oleracea]